MGVSGVQGYETRRDDNMHVMVRTRIHDEDRMDRLDEAWEQVRD